MSILNKGDFMKKIAMFMITAVLCGSSIVIGDGMVLPTCSIVEIKSDEERNIDKDLEDYVVGVVAGEMPPDFPYEALKAQAVATRTYAVRAVKKNPSTNYKSLWQNYITTEDMKNRWGSDYDKWYSKIKSVVYDTAGEIIEYNNEPILAVFYSTSCGKTEECENVWTEDLPYLTSVSSEGDIYSPYYENRVTVKKSALKNNYGSSNISVENKTQAGYVTSVNIGGKSIKAENIRSTFGLRSTAFDITENGDSVVFITRGFGHGVGMSQYGACYMANNGADYKDILTHYYKDTIIKNL